MPEQLTTHEAIQLHKMLSLKALYLTKSKIMQTIVSDKELKGIFHKDIQRTTKSIQDFQEILSQQ